MVREAHSKQSDGVRCRTKNRLRSLEFGLGRGYLAGSKVGRKRKDPVRREVRKIGYREVGRKKIRNNCFKIV